MMKKLVVLFIAVAALFAFSACEPYAVTLDDVGASNYTLKGKTLVRTDYSYITANVYTSVIDASVTPAANTQSTTTTYIPYLEKTTTVTFADDGTYSKSYTELYLPAADGDYSPTTKTTTNKAITTTTETTYSGWNGYYDFSVGEHVGLAYETRKTTSQTGTWELVKKQYSPDAEKTYHYYVTTPSTTTTTTTFDDDPKIDDKTSKITITYKVNGSNTYTTTSTSDPTNIYYKWIREDADGNDIVELFDDYYTVQP